jgi:uncharacterized protein (DUF1778 family)
MPLDDAASQSKVPKRCHFPIDFGEPTCIVEPMKTAGTKSSAKAVAKKVVRINPRFPESTAKRLKQAAAIRGQSVAAFVLEVVSHEAERVLEEEKYWNMSVEAAENIQRMLAKPPAINAAAKKAAKDLASNVRIRS